MSFLFFLIVAPFFIVLISIRQVNQFEKGVRFQLGKFLDVMEPGWRLVWPIVNTWQKVDIRVKAVDVPDQEAITNDNVSARVNAVIYYRVADAKKAVIEVEDFFFAVSQMAQTTMRNVVGETSLDDLLSKRNEVADNIQSIIDKATDPWGIKVEAVELKDIVLPQEMKRVIAKQAEAERERRAIIIRAAGEKAAAENMALAAKRLSSAAGGMHLRTLQTVNEVSADKNNTVIFVTPIEVLRALEGILKKKQ